MKNFIDSVLTSESSGNHKLTIILDYSHFTKPDGWTKLLQIVCGILSIACCAPAYLASQVFFLVVMVWQLIISISLAIIRLKFVAFNDYGKVAEFAYTIGTSLFCFAAWTTQFLDLNEFSLIFPSRKGALIAAGSFGVINNIMLVVSAALQYQGAVAALAEIRSNTRS